MERRFPYPVYNMILFLAWPALFLYYFLRARLDGKYRGSYPARLGLRLPPRARNGRRIWVHALSVGETLSSVALVEALRELHPEAWIGFSTSTETGGEIARRRLGGRVDSFFFLPHDFAWVQARLVERLAPTVFVLVETDLWPNLLIELERRRVPAFLVNGRISPKSFSRYMRLRPLVGDVLGRFSLIFSQSPLDKKRYEALGMPPERVLAAGNLKFDSSLTPVSPGDVERLREETGIGAEREAWAAGSTHEGEEEKLLAIHRRLRERRPDLLLILAPRQTRRAEKIEALCAAMGLSVGKRSTGASAAGKAVYLVDTVGELAFFYAFASVAFIGGSLVPFGGHNPLEATAQGKAVLWGPHLFNFRQIEAGLLDAGCGRRVESPEELSGALESLLEDRAAGRAMAGAAAAFLSAHSGYSRKVAQIVLSPLT